MLAFQETDRKTGSATKDRDRESKIRCPKCRWRPEKRSRWSCLCGHSWNTFDTHGVCPSCAIVWRETACPSCHQWSPHEDWYDRGGDDHPFR